MPHGHEVKNNSRENDIMNKNEVFSSTEFGSFLLESRMVASGKEKFLVHWIRKFYEYSKQLPVNLNWSEQLSLFLRELNASGSHQDWQVRQADQTVRLNFINFLAAFPDIKGPDSGPLPPVVPRGQDAVLQRFREDLRLRNYSRRQKRRILAGLDSISAIVSKENPAKKRMVRAQKRAE